MYNIKPENQSHYCCTDQKKKHEGLVKKTFTVNRVGIETYRIMFFITSYTVSFKACT